MIHCSIVLFLLYYCLFLSPFNISWKNVDKIKVCGQTQVEVKMFPFDNSLNKIENRIYLNILIELYNNELYILNVLQLT